MKSSYNERLMQEALKGSNSSYKELLSNAGSGNAEAQYYLALYYKEVKGSGPDSDYAYWMKEAKNNGFDAAKNPVIEEPVIEEPVIEQSNKTELDSNGDLKKLLMKFSFMGRINRTEYIISIIISILLLLLSSVIENGIGKNILLIIGDWLWLSQGARRLHDFGASGGWILIPVVSWIYIIFPKGDEGENEYGKAPA